MKISTKGRYALRIMIDLAVYSKETCIPLKDISERQGITIKYMEQIMPLLTRAGYVKSFRGNNGGYKLAYDPKKYTVGQILRQRKEAFLRSHVLKMNRTGVCVIKSVRQYSFGKGCKK